MAVNLSPVGGVAAQFFTNNGTPLTGGKLYTYSAGSTTPAATFTSSNGSTAWTNPIVLDAAGRVSGSGEIWLTDGIIYKFILKDSNDVLIATYDNITGINSNSVAFVNQQEIVTATAGQTVFNLGINYQPGTNSLSVFVDGVNQYGPGALYAYVETDSNTVTFNSGLHVGAEVKFTTTQQQSAGAVDASQVTYTPPLTGFVATNVEAKLAQTVSVLDFGADPTGVADSSGAIQDAIDAVGALGSIIYPAGTYKINSTVTLLTQQHHIGFNAKITVGSGVTAFSRTTDGFPGRIKFSDLRFEGTGNTGKAISITNNTPFVQLENCYFKDFARAVELSGSYCSNFSSCYFSYNLYGVLLLNECHSTQLINCFFDGNTYVGLAVNGTPPDGNLGTNVHNITSVGCAYQNSEFGVWVESCYEFAAYSTYHEGNSKADMRLGVGDAGVYNRFCYSFTIDSWQSSSPCASGKNIIMEHAVGGNLRGLAFNAGCSTTATLLEVDGFSDKIEIDYHQFTTVTPTATAPFNFIGDAASRVAVFNDGRALYPKGMTSAIRFGTLVAQPEGVYSGFTGSGRPALIMESVGTDQDMVVKVTGIERHQNAAGVDKFYVDHVNSQTVSEYLMKSPLGIVMTTPDGTKNYRIWIDNSGNLTSTLV